MGLGSKLNINSPIPGNLESECKKAQRIITKFIDPGQGLDKIIPTDIISNARGLAIFTVLKAGFLFSGRAGSGIVVARLADDSWSAPSAIVLAGAGAGGQIGAELTDFVLVLNTNDAVETFSRSGSLSFSGNISIAAGPIGRNAEAGGAMTLGHVASVYSYSKTKGVFAGVSIEGSAVVARKDANEKFYGRRVTVKELLSGAEPPPPQADNLYRALNARFKSLGNTSTHYHNSNSDTTPTNVSSSISPVGTLRRPNPPQPPNGFSGAPSWQQPAPPPAYTPSSTVQPTYDQKVAPPAQRARPPPPPPPASRKPNVQRARAIYDFEQREDGDLGFKTGDIITIVEKSDSQNDWWTGSIGARKGLFPANYVEMM